MRFGAVPYLVLSLSRAPGWGGTHDQTYIMVKMGVDGCRVRRRAESCAFSHACKIFLPSA